MSSIYTKHFEDNFSPQYPCKYAARQVASKGSYPWAIKDVIIPVRQSPIPPDAIALFPVEFTNTSSPFVIMVLYPFKSNIILFSLANSLANFNLFSFI